MVYKPMSNPFKYRAHYSARIKGQYAPLTHKVEIIQPENARIYVIYNGISYDYSFSVQEEQIIRIYIEYNDGYTSNSFTINGEQIVADKDYVIREDVTIQANVVKQSYLVELSSDEHSRLFVVHGGTVETSSFYASHGENIEVYSEVTEVGYVINSLTLDGYPIQQHEHYIVTDSIKVKTTSEIERFLVHIIQPDGFIPPEEVPDLNIITLDQPANGRLELTCEAINVSKGTDARYEIPKGADYTVELTANDGYRVDNFYVDETEPQTTASGNRIEVLYNGEIQYYDFYVNYGDQITITAYANSLNGYEVQDVLFGDEVIVNGSTQSVYKEVTISTVLATQELVVTILQPTDAKITAMYNGNTYDSSFMVKYQAEVSFYVEINDPETHYLRKLLLNGDQISQNAPIRISQNSTITADIGVVDVSKTHNINIRQVEGATIYASYNQRLYTESFIAVEGYPITIYVVPEPEYDITSFKLDDQELGIADRYVFTVTKDFVITCTTKLKTYQITINQVANGTISVEYENKIYTSSFTGVHSKKMRISVTPLQSHNLSSITVNGQKVSNNSEWTITGPVSITAAYTIKTFKVYVTQPANGKILVNNSQDTEFTFNYGTQITVQAVANSGYKVKSFTKTDV